MGVTARLADRTAVVFGGGHPGVGPHGVLAIGYACAATFAAHGADVVIVDRDADAARDAADAIVAAGGSAIAVVADMLDEAAVSAAVDTAIDRFGHIDVVQNNVGATLLGGVTDVSLEQWRTAVAVNLDSVFLGARTTLPHLVATRGSMINVSSTASIRWTGFRYPAYSAAKAAVNQLTQSLALQYAEAGVRVNAILPGLIDTPMAYRELAEGHDLDAVRAERAAKSPTGSMGSAHDVANAALFLATADSGYITGALIPVDGGLHARVI